MIWASLHSPLTSNPEGWSPSPPHPPPFWLSCIRVTWHNLPAGANTVISLQIKIVIHLVQFTQGLSFDTCNYYEHGANTISGRHQELSLIRKHGVVPTNLWVHYLLLLCVLGVQIIRYTDLSFPEDQRGQVWLLFFCTLKMIKLYCHPSMTFLLLLLKWQTYSLYYNAYKILQITHFVVFEYFIQCMSELIRCRNSLPKPAIFLTWWLLGKRPTLSF